MQYLKIKVNGRVQGVGFRYFVYNVANRFGLTGFVQNSRTSYDEVLIEVEGEEETLNEFIKQVKIGPPLSKVTNINIEKLEYKNLYSEFFIKH